MKLKTGLTNDVWKVRSGSGFNIIKKINANAPHARTLVEYHQVEKLKKIFSENHIPVVMAKEINDSEIIFPYVKAEVLYSAMGPTSEKHAYIAGKLLGKLHSLTIREFSGDLHFDFTTNQTGLLKIIEHGKKSSWYKKIDIDKLLEINEKCLLSVQRLSNNLIFSHCDFYPHNILWNEDDYYLIDWEFAGLINPGLEFFLGAICFASDKFKEGYFSTGAKIEDDPEDCFWGAINNGWVYWIIYNMQIAVDDRFSEVTRKKASVNVVEYYSHLLFIVQSL